MKILQVSHGLPPQENAGVELYTYYLSKALRHNHEVSIFSREANPEEDEFMWYEEEVEGLKVIRIVNNLTQVSDPRTLYDNHHFDRIFSKILDRERPDLVHFQHIFGLSAYLMTIAKQEGYPVVFTLHDFFILCPRIHLLRGDHHICAGPLYGLECASCVETLPPHDTRTKIFLSVKDILPFPIIKWTKRFFIPPKYLRERGYEVFHRYRYMYERMKSCDLLLAPSSFVRDLFLTYYPALTSKTRVLPLGMPPLREPHHRKEPREKIRFCYFGNILPHKGLHILVDTFKTLPKGKAILTIYGSPTQWTKNYYDQLKEEASGFEIDFRGSFQREDLPHILSDQDVAILPSLCPESFSFTIREANSLGLPVIASRIGAIPEAVKEGVNGFLFDPGNRDDLRKSILRIVQDPGLLRQVAPRRSKVKSMTEHALELEEIYKEIIGKKTYDYSDYASRMMDREIIQRQQQPRVAFFKGCKRVLDLACGPGYFLELLKEAGIDAVGVDRNEAIVKKGRFQELEIVHSDLFDYLENVDKRYDGIFCSHLLEHLPFDQVVRLIELIHRRLDSEGVLVFVFPNPESIRLHLFGFWRDPEHVRFYTGSLIESVCHHYGFRTQYSNEKETPHALEPPYLEPVSGLSSGEEMDFPLSEFNARMGSFFEEFNEKIGAFNQKIQGFCNALNQIWAKPDEVVLVLKK